MQLLGRRDVTPEFISHAQIELCRVQRCSYIVASKWRNVVEEAALARRDSRIASDDIAHYVCLIIGRFILLPKAFESFLGKPRR